MHNIIEDYGDLILGLIGMILPISIFSFILMKVLM